MNIKNKKEFVSWLCMSWAIIMMIVAFALFMVGNYFFSVFAIIWAVAEIAGTYYFNPGWFNNIAEEPTGRNIIEIKRYRKLTFKEWIRFQIFKIKY